MRPMSATAPATQVNKVHQNDGSAKQTKGCKANTKGVKQKSGGFQDKRCYNCNILRSTEEAVPSAEREVGN